MTRDIYQGTIEWHKEEPPKAGRYLVSCNAKNVYVFRYIKESDRRYWEWDVVESENGGYMQFDTVEAWAFLPEPYRGKTR